MDNYIQTLADKYELPVDFVNDLYGKIKDKENIGRAVRMYHNGTLSIELVKSAEADGLDIAALRHSIATNLWNRRKVLNEQVQQAIERERKVFDLLNSCDRETLTNPDGFVDAVYINDGVIVAFARYRGKKGGIYAANFEFDKPFQWEPKTHLGRLRKANKAFYRTIKKHAYNSPTEWFDFNDRTITKR